MHAYIYTCIHMYVYIYIYGGVVSAECGVRPVRLLLQHLCVCVCIYTCICIHMYVYVYIWRCCRR